MGEGTIFGTRVYMGEDLSLKTQMVTRPGTSDTGDAWPQNTLVTEDNYRATPGYYKEIILTIWIIIINILHYYTYIFILINAKIFLKLIKINL